MPNGVTFENVGGGGGSMTPLPNEQIYIGDITSVAQPRTLSLSATGGTFALANTGVLTMPNADATTRGLLTAADWVIFNGKQASISDWQTAFGSGTQATSTWSATNAATNVNAAIVPKGTGALLVDLPDGTATGGNARGNNAVDLQHTRTTAAQVASGNQSVVGGGVNNTASGLDSVVAGGRGNIASGEKSFIGGGISNTAAQFYHTIGGGFTNTTQTGGDGQTIAGGGNNTTGGTWSTIGGGQSNIANGNYTTVAGGFDHTIQSASQYGFIGSGNVNTITSGESSVIVGGSSNTVNVAATGIAFIGGGTLNSITAAGSVIGGGRSNTVSGADSVIVGGNSNSTGSSLQSFIGGGFSNSAFNNYSVICGGYDNTSTGASGFVGGGEQNNHAGGSYATIVGGQSNYANSNWGFLGGGFQNQLNEQFTGIAGGRQANAYLYGMQAYSAGQFTALADAQAATIQMRTIVTGTGIADLWLDGASVRAILPSTNTLWAVRVQLAAICTNVGGGSTLVLGASYAAERQCAIKRLGTTTSLVGAVQTIGANLSDTTMSTSVVTITADDTNEALRVQFTPPSTAGASSTIRVVATIQLTQIKY